MPRTKTGGDQWVLHINCTFFLFVVSIYSSFVKGFTHTCTNTKPQTHTPPLHQEAASAGLWAAPLRKSSRLLVECLQQWSGWTWKWDSRISHQEHQDELNRCSALQWDSHVSLCKHNSCCFLQRSQQWPNLTGREILPVRFAQERVGSIVYFYRMMALHTEARLPQLFHLIIYIIIYEQQILTVNATLVHKLFILLFILSTFPIYYVILYIDI